MEEFKSNSHKSKSETQKEPEKKIVKGNVQVKKKSEVRKFTDVFISEDINTVKNYILMDVLVPAFKNVLVDVVEKGIRMLVNGTTSDKSSSLPNVSYRNYNKPNANTSNIRAYDACRSNRNYENIVIDNRGEAEEVLDRLDEIITAYGIASVADLLDLVGINSEYTDNKYGWQSLRTACVVRVTNGYLLKLPKASPINNI